MDATTQLNDALTGRYKVEREAGTGGMATVYVARDLRHDRHVALKVLHPDLAAALGAERFLAEIRTTAGLQHPHILPLHDSGEAGGHLFYVMPFVEGETLRARLNRETLLPIDEALRIAREVLGALDYAHRHGVVHRDVKPENILLHDGSALVADFGIALAVSAAGSQRMTQTGLSLGTPQYMSPEQAMGEKGIDGRTDIYALGAVLYEMLTGEPPFSGANVQAIVAKVLTERPSPPTTVRDTIPRHVEVSVLRALAKLPADRFATAKDFVDALSGTTTIAAEGRIEAPHGASRKLAWGAVGAVAGALVVWAALQLRPDPAQRAERYSLGPVSQLDVPLTSTMTYTGQSLSISDDGFRIAYVTRDSSGTSVAVRDLDRLTPRPVAGTDGATSVALSHDGSMIAFIVNGELWVTDVRGGTPRQLVRRRAAAPEWDEDGRIYFTAPSIGAGVGGVFRISAAGGTPDTLLTKAGTEFFDPVPLPGGKGLLVRAAGAMPINVLEFDSGILRPLLAGNSPRYLGSGHIVFRGPAGALMRIAFDPGSLEIRGEPESILDADGELPLVAARFALASNGTLVYITGSGQTSEFAWVRRDGTLPEAIDSTIVGAVDFPALSPDGSRFAFRQTGQGIVVYDLRARSVVRMSTGRTDGNYVAWTPDGRSVSFFARGGATGGDSISVIYRKPADGSAAATEIARTDRSIGESTWSPDGQWLVVRTFSNQRGAGDILGMRPGVDSALSPLIATEAAELNPTISPDGRWLAYSTDESGRLEVIVVPFPRATGAAWAISQDGGTEPRWSRSGKELFYRDGRGRMMSVPVSSGSTFTFGAPRALFSAAGFRAYSGHQAYDVSADGQRFLVTIPARTRRAQEMVVVRNWAATLPDAPRRR